MLFKPMDLIDMQDVETDNKSICNFQNMHVKKKKAGKVTEVLNIY